MKHLGGVSMHEVCSLVTASYCTIQVSKLNRKGMWRAQWTQEHPSYCLSR
jgi:hypothetical protein